MFLYMDLFIAGGEGPAGLARLHVDGQKFSFASLGERKVHQGLGNFRLFLTDAAKGAAGAPRNRGAQVFLSNRPLNTLGYGAQADYEKECRWLLTLQRKAA